MVHWAPLRFIATGELGVRLQYYDNNYKPRPDPALWHSPQNGADPDNPGNPENNGDLFVANIGGPATIELTTALACTDRYPYRQANTSHRGRVHSKMSQPNLLVKNRLLDVWMMDDVWMYTLYIYIS